MTPAEHAKALAKDTLKGFSINQGLTFEQWQDLEERLVAALTAAHEAGRQAGLRDIEEQWKEEYEKVLDEQNSKINYMEANKDTHGWNLHQGLRFGAIEMDLAFGRILNRFRQQAGRGGGG